MHRGNWDKAYTSLRGLRVFGSALAGAGWMACASAAWAQPYQLIEGDAWHKADVARATYKKADGSAVDGAGVKVCAMSDSIDDARSARYVAEQAGAIPTAIDIPSGQQGTGIGEGLAMLEIVHKIAPAATLGFATGTGAISQQEANFNALVAADCKIIVDDITDPRDAPFQDSQIAKAYNAASAKGVLLVSSAGNLPPSSVWEGDFSDAGTVAAFGDRRRVHDFAPQFYDFMTQKRGKTALALTAPTREIWLYWSDPDGAATSVYSLWVFSQRMNSFLTRTGYAVNRPFAFINATLIDDSRLNCVTGSTVKKDNCFLAGDVIMVTKDDLNDKTTTPSPPRYLRVYVGKSTIEFPAGPGNVTFGHNAAESVISVGAVQSPSFVWVEQPQTEPGVRRQVPKLGVFTADSPAEPQSAPGPRRIFYNPDGTPITPGNVLAQTRGGRVLNKPDLAAANLVRTTLPPGTLNPFEGTSAAAPHVGGIAALVWSYRPGITAPRVREILIGSAIGRGPWDMSKGYGIPMADRALAIADSLQAVDTAFNPKLANDLEWGGAVSALAIQQDGKILVGGAFGGQPLVQRLNADGSVDSSFKGPLSSDLPPSAGKQPMEAPTVATMAVQANGKILIGGNIGVWRLNADGKQDTTFKTPETRWAGSDALALAVQPDNKIIVGGAWGLARLNENGSFDTSFAVQVDGAVIALARQPDGKIVIGGRFSEVKGEARRNIARLNANGTLDTSINYISDLPGVQWMALEGDGRLIVVGPSYIKRINVNGSADANFNATITGPNTGRMIVKSLADGKVLVGGKFYEVNGESWRGGIVRLNVNGSLDRSFVPAVNDGDVRALEPRAASLLFGGRFDTVNGQARANLVQVKAP